MNGAIGYLRELLDVLSLVRNLWGRRELIRTLTWQGFAARHRATIGGLGWAVAQPLIMMVVYTVVFAMFLKLRFSQDDTPASFAIFVLCGLLVWNGLAEPVANAVGLIRANLNYVKRVVFPLEVLPLAAAGSAGIQQAIGFVLLLLLVILDTAGLSWTILLVPFLFVAQLLFVVGISWIVASLSVFLPDLGEIVPVVLTAWMFLTPIFYPVDMLPDWARSMMYLNPMALLVASYREIIIVGQLPSATTAGLLLGECVLTFLFGYFWFMHTKEGFADVL